MSDRDHRILHLLRDHRYLTTLQIQAFCFADHASEGSGARSARRVLRRLADHRLITALERRVGGVRAGSASYIWQLAPAGGRLVTDATGFRPHEPSPRFLAHCLAVADAHLAAVRLQRQGAIEECRVQLEPECWRSFSGLGGELRLLQPDLFIRTTTPDFVDSWFVEVDLATESIPTVLGKCAIYEAYRASGQEQSASDVFPLVVWQLPDERRRDALASRIARSTQLTPLLYRLVTPAQLPSLLAGGAI